MANLQKQHKKIIYDIVDKPYGQNAADRQRMEDIFKLADGIIVSSPLQERDFAGSNKILALIEHPVINTILKNYDKTDPNRIRIIWQGFSEHRQRLEFLHPIIEQIARELGKKITFIYHTNLLPKRNGPVKIKTWTIHNWEKALVEADIAVEVKTVGDPFLQRKPSTKAILYAAAGLPVVLTPSAADMLAVEHGRTGYFAYSPEEWYEYLKQLAQDPSLRQTMGLFARKLALENFSIEKVGQKYIRLFDRLI